MQKGKDEPLKTWNLLQRHRDEYSRFYQAKEHSKYFMSLLQIISLEKEVQLVWTFDLKSTYENCGTLLHAHVS